MSIINDTLKQLERSGRNPSAIAPTFSASQVVTAAKPRAKHKWLVVVLLLAIVLWLWWPTLTPLLANMSADNNKLLTPSEPDVAIETSLPVALEPQAQTIASVALPDTQLTPVPVEEAAVIEPNAPDLAEVESNAVQAVAKTMIEVEQPQPIRRDEATPVLANINQQPTFSAPVKSAESTPKRVGKVTQPQPVATLQVQPSPLSPQQLAQQLWQQAQTETDPRATLQRALELDPELHQARVALISLMPVDEAERLLQRALAQYPRYAGYAIVAAQRAINRDEHTLAQQWLQFSQSLSVEPVQLAQRATLLQQLQQHEMAAQDWQQLAQLQPNNPNWWVSLAYNLEFIASSDQAINAYQQALLLPGLDASATDYAQQRLQQLRGSK
ncbi:tetratricopeptide repeat protein [Ferrimonas lipolytica]|uniref:tetratricopeptide repeat protein n=1 Tax=Ferrimonas lipolytica TaxID=2724191 RepID=UPI001EEC98BD|nr:tetratricopeptide repeat protein [Ferrimonas lipolytica]